MDLQNLVDNLLAKWNSLSAGEQPPHLGERLEELFLEASMLEAVGTLLSCHAWTCKHESYVGRWGLTLPFPCASASIPLHIYHVQASPNQDTLAAERNADAYFTSEGLSKGHWAPRT